jgi:hypothetical protein
VKNAKFWHQHLRGDKGQPPSSALGKSPVTAPLGEESKLAKAKVNSGLRSTS